MYVKYELTPDDHHVEIFYQDYVLEDQLTLMDVIYMFDWKTVKYSKLISKLVLSRLFKIFNL